MGMIGEAGRGGKESRSDCRAVFEKKDRGGIKVVVASKVKVMYGRSIDKLCRDVLTTLGVGHCLLTLEDQGALPFVIAARVEAAVKRAMPDIKRSYVPKGRRSLRRHPIRECPRRSRLYVPGTEPKYMVNAGLYGADAIIFDLEDSVPSSEKDAARLLVRNALKALDLKGAELMVRIDPLPLGLADLEAIVPAGADMVLLPKCENAEQVREADRSIAKIAKGARAGEGPLLMPIIETATGLMNCESIASSSPRVAAMTLGLEDYTADIGGRRTSDGLSALYARSRIVNASRAFCISPIDTIYPDVDDLEGLASYARMSRSMGFDGMGCIHPRQVPVINDAFSPDDEELSKARRIVLAFEEAERSGKGVVNVGSKMVDPPVVKRALRVVSEAVASGKLDKDWREKDG